jgi:predicted nucleic acid-binding protein
MILLDTNIVSELYKPQPYFSVVTWLNNQSDLLYLCTPVLAELRFGMECLDAGARKELLRTAIERLENELYRDRVLVFDKAAASAYGRIAAARRQSGRPIQQMDACIAAIALANGAILATRNTRHFGELGLDLINPFDAFTDR